MVKNKEVPPDQELFKILDKIVNRLEKLENTINKPITSQIETINEPKLTEEIKPVEAYSPIPKDWKEMVETVLNKNFEVEIEPHRDAPLTTFTVIVPEKYSQMTPSQREIIKRDIRPKVITNAGGVAEVKEWTEIVYKNLTPEIQAMVVADRSKI